MQYELHSLNNLTPCLEQQNQCCISFEQKLDVLTAGDTLTIEFEDKSKHDPLKDVNISTITTSTLSSCSDIENASKPSNAVRCKSPSLQNANLGWWQQTLEEGTYILPNQIATAFWKNWLEAKMLNGGYKYPNLAAAVLKRKKMALKPAAEAFQKIQKSELIKAHAETHYHKVAVAQGSNFMRTFLHPENSAEADKTSEQYYPPNQHVLATIVDAILLCAKQRLSLRGHRDTKVNDMGESSENRRNLFAITELIAKDPIYI
eukprot:gene3526-2008_t